MQIKDGENKVVKTYSRLREIYKSLCKVIVSFYQACVYFCLTLTLEFFQRHTFVVLCV